MKLVELGKHYHTSRSGVPVASVEVVTSEVESHTREHPVSEV